MTGPKIAPHGFPVVGVGASAGGVNALKAFFSAVPADSGMAYVVIVHLSKEHESRLPEILQKSTSMPVRQVTEMLKVEPDHVYVIPPEGNLEMVDGMIRITSRTDVPGKRIPIDLFFRTLADAYGKDGYAVVLSGTGSDGTMGIERIKEAGGVTLVQDPKEAEFDGMPLSAISTKHVDVVLPAAELPAKILSIHALDTDSKQGIRAVDVPEGNAEDSDSLREVISLVRNGTGHDFTNYKRPTLLRRIGRRLQVHGLTEMGAYVELLRSHTEEVQALLQDLLITVTNFFRDKEAFESLEKEIIPRLFQNKTAKDWVRVWSCGSGTGEEAYSLAMLLIERQTMQKSASKIQVFASDINEEAVRVARAGVYSSAIELDVSSSRLKRFFVKNDGCYHVSKELRAAVLFAPHNLLRDPPFSQLDLIACRNLLIYLNRDTQQKVMETFSFALKPDGYLFLGSSEGAEGSGSLFAPVDKKNRTYQNIQAAKRPPALMAPVLNRIEQLVSPGRSSALEISFENIHHRLASRYAPPSVLVNSDYEIVHLGEGMEVFTQLPVGGPSWDLIKSVHPSLRLDLRAVLNAASQQNREAEVYNISFEVNDVRKHISLLARPTEISGSKYYLVLFDDRGSAGDSEVSRTAFEAVSGDSAMTSVVNRLEDELRESRDLYRSTLEHGGLATEELKASNEELQAMNEELRSATEELETSREELQSVNEEMVTINAELKNKIDEISSNHSDLQNLMHSTDIGTIFLARDLTIKRYTRRVVNLFNVIESDIGRPLAHLTYEFDYDNLLQDAAMVLSTLKTIEREVHVEATKSSYLARLSPYRTVDDRIDGVVISFVDITELKRTSNSLLEREQQLRMAQEAARAGVWSLDLVKGNAWWSDEYAKLHDARLSNIEPTMENWLEVFHPQQAAKVRDEIQSAILNRKQYLHEFNLHPASGERWVMEVGRAIYNSSGQAVQMAGISMDVTERVLLRQEQAVLQRKRELHEETLRDSTRRKDEFLAMVAHELRTPLAPLRTGIEILKNGALQAEEAGAVITTLERQMAQMVRLIDDLLDVSRINSGKMNLEMAVVNLEEVLEHAVEAVRPLLDQMGHQFTVALNAPGLRVRGDAPRLAQVFSNLLTNAAKYTSSGGRIHLELQPADDEAVISIRDNGEGIEADMHERIFDMFGQIERPGRMSQGLGIGLSLVRSLLLKHGGTISVKSDGRGMGSEFIVRLPVLGGSISASGTATGKAGDAEANEPCTVLVVDDGETAANMLAMFLELEGFTPFTAYNGSDALGIFEKEKPDIVLSDIGMPGMDGHELARRIRKLPGGGKVMLVALTGWAQENDKQKSRESGFDHHLTKPVDPKMLRGLLATFAVGKSASF